MTPTLKGGGGRRLGVLDFHFLFLSKKIGSAPWPDINDILLARNLPFDSEVREWSFFEKYTF